MISLMVCFLSRRLIQNAPPLSLLHEWWNKIPSSPSLELFNWHLEFSSFLILLLIFLTDYTDSIYTTFRLENTISFSFFLFYKSFLPFLQRNYNARQGFSKLALLGSLLIYKEFEGEFTEEPLLTFYWIQMWRRVGMYSIWAS